MTVDAAAWTCSTTGTRSVAGIDSLILGQKSAKTRGKFFKNPTISMAACLIQLLWHQPARSMSASLFEAIQSTKFWAKMEKQRIIRKEEEISNETTKRRAYQFKN